VRICEEHAMQPLRYNLLNDFKLSRPGISPTFAQFVRFNSCRLAKFDMSWIVSNEEQF